MMNWRNKIFFLVIIQLITLNTTFVNAQEEQQLNVLFIAIDDINDWIGPLGGNPQAITPNIDKFCNEGAVIFNNAVCAAPICGPSRSAILSGFMPNKTGVYGNSTNMIYSKIVKENATLPEYFSNNGYYTLSNGKIFHKHATEYGVDFGHWAFDEHARARRYMKDSPNPNTLYSAKNGCINGEKKEEYKANAKLSWGPTKKTFEETVDYKVANWTKKQLEKNFDTPFFMAVGLIKPHLPWFVPKDFFEMYAVDSIQPPKVNTNDLNDILNPDGSLLHQPSKEYKWIKKHGLEKEATRAYLANISYADACLGVIFDALEKSKYANNTIVVIWGDHGWHLGEKQRYLKSTLWNEVTKTPFIVRMPNMKTPVYCSRTVSLIDIFPTLNNLCNLPIKENLDGHDFSSLLLDPTAKWDYPGVTISATGTSVTDETWHYIHNLSGAEELYNLKDDPLEWTNLINDPKYKAIIESLKKWVPSGRIVAPKKRYKKPKNYVDAAADSTIKPSRILSVNQ
ncbi:sulfatase-like hydrolase/transferase [Flammeovirga kamogawensis]|uniref:Sulfatase n=1 Tax=Flammeovirga kamogawensis TaxID=373891 RepID=A0ABX8H4E5_9BACT|nr:sulfatase-like hydrolase/transferase [Flammeovirga kamogawensis]MBB6463519.1 arylsulfatase A-like enzyme [Flammeovirga kamogawensis]QWG10578.1 sulfatase [Flammeovirga kamogawensis]TRX63684.1 sulfatase [Flammeovirga kamogawensis]